MSISLNNHESRITALENGGSSIFVTPDYAKAINVSFESTSSYTVPDNGFVIMDLFGNSGSGYYVKVNNSQFHSGYDSNDEEVDCQFVFPVIKGDIVAWSHYVNSGRAGIKFVPYRVTKLYYNLVQYIKGWVM